MSMNDAIGAVTNVMPDFNDYLIKDYRSEQIGRFREFIAAVFQEAVKLYKGELKYIGSRIVSPEERLLHSKEHPYVRNKINIQRTEAVLVEYQFEYGEDTINVPIFVPYLSDNSLVINDTKFYIHLAIIERMIYHTEGGIIIKVMRSPLRFWRNRQLRYESTDGDQYYDTVVTMQAHYKQSTSKKSGAARSVSQLPIILYLLARYDFNHVMNCFNIPIGAIEFVSEIPLGRDSKTDRYKYIRCGHDNLFIRVDKDIVFTEERFNTYRRVLASLVYIMKMTRKADTYDATTPAFYQCILGRSLYPNSASKPMLAADHANSHLESLSTYLDQYNKRELALMHINCNDIFDLLITVFIMIDEWTTLYQVNDLFAKRIGGTELILIEVVKSIFIKFYEAQKKNKITKLSTIQTMLRIPPNCILSNCIKVPSVRSHNDMYNDNDLLCNLIKKIRQSSKKGTQNVNVITDKEHHFHPSFMAVESALALSQSSPGISGDINPYARIDSNGYFVPNEMSWYEAIRDLERYLSNI